MSTTPSPTTFNWQLLLGIIQTAGNTAVSLLVPGGSAFAPLLAELEGSIDPLLLSIGQKNPASQEVMIAFSTTIGILTILKNKPGMPQDQLTKVDEYLIAAQNGLAAYLIAEKGFDASQFLPVAPIA